MEESKRKKKQRERLEKWENEKKKEELNLAGNGLRIGSKGDPPEIRSDGQVWFVYSVVSPTGTTQRSNGVFMKFRGVFPSDTEAEAHAAKVREVDGDFDIFVSKAYEWVPIPPPPEFYEQVPMKYAQDKLDKIMDGYYAKQRQRKLEVNRRAKEAQKEALKKSKISKEKRKHLEDLKQQQQQQEKDRSDE